MSAEVIVIAGEVLAGHTRESHLPVIVRVLREEGMRVTRETVVADELGAIREALQSALARCEVVIVTGGLGGTPDDRTRGAVAGLLSRKNVLHPEILEALREKMRARGMKLPAMAEAMAWLPEGAEPLENPVGMAPGFHLEVNGRHLFAVPGVREEAAAILDGAIRAEIRRLKLGAPWPNVTLRAVHISETTLAGWVEPLLGEGMSAAYLPHHWRVDVRLEAPVGREQDLREVEERVRARLGPAFYGVGESSLEGEVLKKLRERGLTLGVAESLTGGAIGAALTRIPGSSQSFLGDAVVYANAAKEALLGVSSRTLAAHGAVSAETALEMAAGARRVFAASIGISTTGIAGPDGGSPEKPVGLVYCGISTESASASYRFQLGGSRAMIQDRSVTLALNVLWLHLLERLDRLDAALAMRGPVRGGE